MNIIVASGNVVTKHTLRKFVMESGHQCVAPSTGTDILDILSQENPDILVIDFNMPFINGLNLLKNIRQQYPDIYIIILSGYVNITRIILSLSLAPFSCFTRLLHLNQLKAFLNKTSHAGNEDLLTHCSPS